MGLRVFWGLFLSFAFVQNIYAESISLSKRKTGRPAADLVHEGQVLSPGQVVSLRDRLLRSGRDTSELEPVANKLWDGETTELPTGANFPKEGATVSWAGDAIRSVTYSALTKVEKDGKYYRLALSRFSQAVLMRTALMRKLGFRVPEIRYYKDISVKFSSKEELETKLADLQEAVQSDFDSRGWIRNIDMDNLTITFTSATLEVEDRETYNFHWAIGTNRPILAELSKFRAFRSLIIPFILVDVPESINRFSPVVGAIEVNSILLNHQYARTFHMTTYDDALWLIKKAYQLTEEDWQQIVGFSSYPKEIDQLVYAKLVHRVNHLFELFGLGRKLSEPNLRFTSETGLIREGKVTVEHVAGYPQRFAHGDRETPFSNEDLGRYLKIGFLSSGLKAVLTKMNKSLLTLQSTGDIMSQRANVLQNRFNQHLKDVADKAQNGTLAPEDTVFNQKIESFGGFFGGANIDAGRHITSGTYHESQAAIQLVDNVTVSANIGYFRGLDGIKNVFPSVSANLQVNRSYIHVRPLDSVKEASDVPWKRLVVPKFMNDLGKPLMANFVPPERCLESLPEDGLIEGKTLREETDDQANMDEACKHPLDNLMRHLREGEVFTVTDTISAGAGISAMIPLTGIPSFGFASSIVIGVDGFKALLFQTMITRTKTGLQVAFRRFDNWGAGLQFDVNYIINLFQLRLDKKVSKIKTTAYVIEYDPEDSDLLDPETDEGKEFVKKRENLMRALRGIFRFNNGTFVKKRFSKTFAGDEFKIRHKISTKSLYMKFLWMKKRSFRESHHLSVQFPKDPELPEVDPKDEIYEIYSYRRGSLMGKDFFGFLGDIIDGLLKRPGVLSMPSSPNPANTLWGSAAWRIVSTEADVSKGDHATDETVGIIRRIWGGYEMGRKDFLNLVDQINGRFEDIKDRGYRLIEGEHFTNVKKIRFYRVTANFSAYPGAMKKIEDLLMQRRYEDWDAAHGDDRGYRPSDKGIYHQVIEIMGRGSKAVGKLRYKQACEKHTEDMRGSVPPGLPPQVKKRYRGQSYEYCLLPFVKDMIDYKRKFKRGMSRKKYAKMMNRILDGLEQNLTMSALMDFIGEENFTFFVRINGFREGDEDGDIEFFSNTYGEPGTERDLQLGGGLIAELAKDTGLSPTELYRTQGAFR